MDTKHINNKIKMNIEAMNIKDSLKELGALAIKRALN